MGQHGSDLLHWGSCHALPPPPTAAHSLTTALWLLCVQIRAAFLKVEAEYKQVTGEWGSAACCCPCTPLLPLLHTSAAGEAALLWLPMRQSRLAAPSSQHVALQRACAIMEVQKLWSLRAPSFLRPSCLHTCPICFMPCRCGEGGGAEAGRPARGGHGAARVAPHRQPAARPLGAAGRPGVHPLLPVPGGGWRLRQAVVLRVCLLVISGRCGQPCLKMFR